MPDNDHNVLPIGGTPGGFEKRVDNLENEVETLKKGGGGSGMTPGDFKLYIGMQVLAYAVSLAAIIGFAVNISNSHTDDSIKSMEARFEIQDKAMADRFAMQDKLSAERFERILSESRSQTDRMVQELRHNLELERMKRETKSN